MDRQLKLTAIERAENSIWLYHLPLTSVNGQEQQKKNRASAQIK